MKNIAKIISLVTLILVAVPTLFAEENQELESLEQSDRRVEVSREYVPEMQRANKLYITPDMVDTMALRPEMDYVIYPSAWRSGFGVRAINPVKMSTAQFDPRYPFYLKVGGGFPAQSLLDFYASSQEGKVGSITGYINHYGEYSKTKNDLGFKKRAFESLNSLGVLAKLNTGQKTTLEIGGGVEQNIFSKYGNWLYVSKEASDILLKEGKKSPLIGHTTPHARLAFGNDFTDLSYLNFRFGAEGYMIRDRADNKEKGIDAFLELGKMFGVHKAMLNANFKGTFGDGDFKDYYSRIFSVAPHYGIVTEKFKLDVGADFSYVANKSRSSKLYIIPQAKIEFKVVDWLTPYVVLDGKVTNNGMRALINRNPYTSVTPIITNENEGLYPLYDSREYNLRGGVAGSVSTNFSYRIYAGASLIKNPIFLYFTDGYYVKEGEYFTPAFQPIRNKRLRTFVVGVELEARLSGSFMANFNMHYYDHAVKAYDSEQLSYTPTAIGEKAFGLPDFDASLFLRYNYREKFYLTLGAELTGKRKMLDQTFLYNSETMPLDSYQEEYNQSAVVNLSLEAEYKIKRGFGVFLQGNNLANSKLYYYNHIPDQGISVNGGIKLTF